MESDPEQKGASRIVDPRLIVISVLFLTLTVGGVVLAVVSFDRLSTRQLVINKDYIRDTRQIQQELGILLLSLLGDETGVGPDIALDIFDARIDTIEAMNANAGGRSTTFWGAFDTVDLRARVQAVRSSLRAGDEPNVADLKAIQQQIGQSLVRARHLANREIETYAKQATQSQDQAQVLTASVAGVGLCLMGFFLWRVAALHRDWRNLEASLRVQQQDALDARLRAETESRAKSEFLMRMSHELRTPLNAIIGFADFIASGGDALSKDRMIEYAQDIRSAGRHLQSFVEDLLAIARLDTGRLQLSPEDVAYTELAQRAVALGVGANQVVAHHLPKDRLPLRLGIGLANAKGGERVVAALRHPVGVDTEEDIDQVARAKVFARA